MSLRLILKNLFLGYWSTKLHLAFGLGVCAIAVSLAQFSVYRSSDRLAAIEKDRDSLFSALQIAKTRSQSAPSHEPDFTQRFPSEAKVDEVFRDLGRLSRDLQVQVGGTTIQRESVTNAGVQRVDLSLTLVGAYSDAKRMLSQLLERYDSLALKQLSIRTKATDPSRQEWSVILSLFVRA